VVRSSVVLVAFVLVSGIAVWSAREPILVSVGSFLVVQDELASADIIHVISGLDDRTDYAIQLYKQGYGKTLFFTGGWCDKVQGNHAERGKERAQSQGVPSSAIAIDGSEVTSTYAEALRLREFIQSSDEPIRSVIIVSDPYHMRRARWAYRHVLGKGVEVLMAPVPDGLSPYRERWWADAASRRYVEREYGKIVYYYARYKFSWGPVKEWLASLDVD
jgi:uncharacterized SAM-binding protein YcdF (DUF218 family)